MTCEHDVEIHVTGKCNEVILSYRDLRLLVPTIARHHPFKGHPCFCLVIWTVWVAIETCV